jgi:ribosomal 50S subunit-recycling heat shock protein
LQDHIPVQPPNSIRIVLELNKAESRLDAVLLKAIKEHKDLNSREISRTAFKDLFNSGKIQIKGQRARPSSALAKGITYVDILDFKSGSKSK